MTEISTKTKKKTTVFLAIAALVVLVILAVTFITSAGLDKDLVKSKLDEYIAAVKERGEAQGRDINITYDDLEIVGNFTNKHVVIHNPALSIKPSNPQPLKPGEVAKPDALTITTAEIILYPTAMDISSIRLSLTQPINFAATEAPEKSLLKVVGDVPLDFSIAQTKKNNVPYLKIDHTAPGSLDFTYLREQQAEGKEDANPTVVPVYDTLHLTFTAGSSIHADLATDGSNLGTVQVGFKTITLAPQSAPEAIVSIAGVDVNWSNTLNNVKARNVIATANVGPITGPVDVIPDAPIALTIDAAYQAQAPKADTTATEEPKEPAAPATLSVKKLNFTTKDASLAITADFASTPAEMLPSGKANLAIVNFPYFRTQLEKANILKPSNEGWVSAAITQITGTPFEQLKDVNIPIVRDAGSSFKIGNSTLEELIAIVMKQVISQGGVPVPAGTAPATVTTPAPVPVPALPAADKPKAAPIAVPDNGVRG